MNRNATLEPDAPPEATADRARSLLNASNPSSTTSVLAVAPGRVNLIGEHTDYSGGLVLPIAIDRVTAAAVHIPREAPLTRVWTDRAEGLAAADLRHAITPASRLADGTPIAPGDWRSYTVGVLANLADHAREHAIEPVNLDMAIASDIPIGGGLSSSASLEVAIASAAAHAWGLDISRSTLAALCRDAEHRFAGVPCGIMDQAISVHAHRDHALLIDCHTGHIERVPTPSEHQAAILVINSNVRHTLATSQYARRQEACRRAASLLGLHQLRDASRQAIDACAPLGRDHDALAAANHVTGENERTRAAAQALRSGDLEHVGRLMMESHASLRDVYRVSCPELDAIVLAASGTPGVFGARMTGGGFGGCAVALLRPAALPDLCENIAASARNHGFPPPSFFRVRASDGARLL